MDDITGQSRRTSLQRGFLALDEAVNNHDYLSRVLNFIIETHTDPLAWKWVVIALHAAIYGPAVRRCTGTNYFRLLSRICG